MNPTKDDYRRLYLGEEGMKNRDLRRVEQESAMLVNQFGKLPPQAIEIEEAVLGQLLLSSQGRDVVIPLLKPETFYKNANQTIFSAIQDLFNFNQGIDLLTVNEHLRKNGKLEEVGGSYYLTQLTRPVASSQNLEYHARIITQKFLQREIIRISGEMMRDSYSELADVFELIERLNNHATDLNKHIVGKDYETDYGSLVEETYNEILEKSEHEFTGIDTGSHKLNQLTGGWQNTDLIIVAARPSMGKSTRMVSFVKSALLSGKKCAVFTLEMSGKQIIKKQLSEQSGIFGDKLLRSELNEFDKPRLLQAKDDLKKLPLYLNDKPAISPNYIRTVCKERKKKYGLDMIFIDYIQLMKPNSQSKGGNREQDVASISAELKNLAKELNIPVMALSQLNRELDKRADKRPILSDLRESGAIEQDADMVIGLYRPSWYYKFEKDSDYKDRTELTEEMYKRISEAHVLKHRNGKAGVYLEENFYGELSRYNTGIESESGEVSF